MSDDDKKSVASDASARTTTQRPFSPRLHLQPPSPTIPTPLPNRTLYRITTQSGRAKILKEWEEELSQEEDQDLSRESLKAKLDSLESLWQKFSAVHEKLEEEVSDALMTHPYMAEEVYTQTCRIYMHLRTSLTERLCRYETQPESAHSEVRGESSSARRLPEISLPTFTGEYSEWVPFRDFFSSLVLDNSSITDVERMHYLRTSLSGEAAKLISSLPVSGDSLMAAWQSLTARFENKRLLISSHLDNLTCTQPITPRSARALNVFLNTTTEALNALKSLGSPVEHWDQLLVHLTLKWLDSVTKEFWELKLGSSTEYPSFQQLTTHLTSRARALENVGRGTPPTVALPVKSTTQPAAKSTPQVSTARAYSSSSESVSYPCTCCQASHYIVTCPRFRQLSRQARREFVINYKLCFNCLGNNSANSCMSSKRCKECGNKHHTMIHTIPVSSATHHGSSSSASTQDDTTHFIRPMVLLATAQALLITQFGGSHRVRMLIDPGSELTFISEQLVKRFELARRQSTISIIGIGGISSGQTRGVVCFQLQSLYSSEAISIHAYVLSKLMTTLPLFSVADQGWPHLANLQLADLEFLTPRSVDSILGADSYGLFIKSDAVKGALQTPIAQRTVFGWIV